MWFMTVWSCRLTIKQDLGASAPVADSFMPDIPANTGDIRDIPGSYYQTGMVPNAPWQSSQWVQDPLASAHTMVAPQVIFSSYL